MFIDFFRIFYFTGPSRMGKIMCIKIKEFMYFLDILKENNGFKWSTKRIGHTCFFNFSYRDILSGAHRMIILYWSRIVWLCLRFGRLKNRVDVFLLKVSSF